MWGRTPFEWHTIQYGLCIALAKRPTFFGGEVVLPHSEGGGGDEVAVPPQARGAREGLLDQNFCGEMGDQEVEE
jgi:hypothetical protein